MNILILGNDPHDIAGVANYSRELASEFSKMGHNVFYFFSGAWNKKYNWFLKPYLRINKADFPFECAELINSPNWTHNYGFPLKDITGPRTEKLFIKYINKIRPDVMHVHSRLGLPFSLVEIAAKQGIKIFNTVHVYGLLCQKRVMIDQAGKPCIGPNDIHKCVRCTGKLNIKKLKFFMRLDNTSEKLLHWLIVLKNKLSLFAKEDVTSDRRIIGDNPVLAAKMQKRLDYMIDVMNNYVTMNICVSSDVKRVLIKYRIKASNLMVQHIGSRIRTDQKYRKRKLHDPLVFGNIGGVSYYKGTHVLIDAIRQLRKRRFLLKIFGKDESSLLKKIIKENESLPVQFLGRYKLRDLPGILEQVDIMVLPSICNDTAPQTIFETYSAGIPILASRIGGFPDFISDGVNGYLFKPGDSKDLADKIDKIINDPERISFLAKNIPEIKTINVNARELVDLYKKSTSRKN